MPRKAFGIGAGPAPIGICTAIGLAPSRLTDLLERALEIGADAVHLVDEADARDAVLVGLPPDRFALGLDPFDGAEDHERPVEHAQAALDLGGEIDVPRRVDDVDRVLGDAAARSSSGR